MNSISLFWYRRDLRLDDNTALFHALKENKQVLALFIFDKEILDQLPEKNDPRVTFIHQQLAQIHQHLQALGSTLLVRHGTPDQVFRELMKEYSITSVYTNHDYEPYAQERDERVKSLLSVKGIPFHSFKDQVIFEKDEVVGEGGKPYRVFTPYKNKWLQKLALTSLPAYPAEKHHHSFFKTQALPFLSITDIGFQPSAIALPEKKIIKKQIEVYNQTRDFPHQNTTSRLGIHLRFGTVSIRKVVAKAQELNETWLSELIWREFFMQLLFHFPQVVDQPFNSKFRNMKWRHDENDFQKWCEGKTGYPLVDAGMRELNATHFMHNRVRMVAASFLTKHLLIDWKWGEAYFAQKLLDFDLSSNNGNWQWSAGTGADAQPFFRIFNPTLQQQRFDPDFKYIQQWVPEYGTPDYPPPMIEHKHAVARAKAAFSTLGMASASE